MHDTITIAHGLASFDVTHEPKTVLSVGGQKVTLTRGRITEELPRTCPHCGQAMVHELDLQ